MAAQKPTVVLVPGAWHFPACFDQLISFLKDKGYETRKVTLRSVLREDQTAVTSHHEDANIIRGHVQDLVSQEKDVVVLAHSYGGVPTTDALAGLAKTTGTHGVIRIIFCTAVAPAVGESSLDVVGKPELADLCAKDFTRPSEDGTTVHLIKTPTMKTFYPDVNAKVAEEQYSLLGSHSFGSWTTPVTNCAWKEIPASYIVCKNDRAFQAFVQRWMARRAGIDDVVEIDSAHSPFLSKPAELADIVDKMIQNS